MASLSNGVEIEGFCWGEVTQEPTLGVSSAKIILANRCPDLTLNALKELYVSLKGACVADDDGKLVKLVTQQSWHSKLDRMEQELIQKVASKPEKVTEEEPGYAEYFDNFLTPLRQLQKGIEILKTTLSRSVSEQKSDSEAFRGVTPANGAKSLLTWVTGTGDNDPCGFVLYPSAACLNDIRKAIETSDQDVDVIDDEPQNKDVRIAVYLNEKLEEDLTITEELAKQRDVVLKRAMDLIAGLPNGSLTNNRLETDLTGVIVKVWFKVDPTEVQPKEPFHVFPEQEQKADELFEAAKRILGKNISGFKGFDFLIVCPKFSTLKEQTKYRLRKADDLVSNGQEHLHVAVTGLNVDSSNPAWKRFKDAILADKNQETLYAMIVDECHYAPTKDGIQDRMVNDADLLGRKNVIVVQVSATPQNVLTCNSRVLPENIINWDPSPHSHYRSLDHFIGTSLWSPVGFEFRMKRCDESDAVIKLDSYRYPPFAYGKVADDVNRLMQMDQDAAKVWAGCSLKCDDFKFKLTVPKRTAKQFFMSSQTRELLGFGAEKDLTEYTTAEGRDVAMCDPNCNKEGCKPLVDQRVRSDETMEGLLSRFEKFKGMELGDNIKAHRGHLLMTDYLLSLVYFKHFRIYVNEETEEVLKGATMLSESDLFEGDKLTGFLISLKQISDLNVKVKLDQASEDETQILMKPLVDLVEADVLTEAVVTFCTMYDGDELAGYLVQCNKDPDLETYAVPINSLSNYARRRLWARVLEAKLKEDLRSLESNDRLTWFTESDRLIETLLTVKKPCLVSDRVGNLAFARVYENQHCLIMQECMQQAMQTLRMTYKDGRPFFAVVSDTGSIDLYDGLLKQKWLHQPLTAFNDRPKLLDKSGKDCKPLILYEETVRTRHTIPIWDPTFESLFEVGPRSCSGPNVVLKSENFKASPQSKALQYKDLENVPALIFLCEKGRMGDTFPHSLAVMDLRLRVAGAYSTFIQEFGRACRYPKLDTRPLVQIKLEDLIPKPPDAVMKRSKAGYGMVVMRKGKVLQHLSDRQELERYWQIGPMLGDELFPYKYRLPTVLLTKSVCNRFIPACDLQNAFKARGKTVPLIMCFSMAELDGYAHHVKKGHTMDKIQCDLIKSLWGSSQPDPKNTLHGCEEGYMKNFAPIPLLSSSAKPPKAGVKPLEGGEGKEKLKVHYDRLDVKPDGHARRLLLFAQCQMGKTGTYLWFLLRLKNSIADTYEFPPSQPLALTEKNKLLFFLPYWKDMAARNPLSLKYNQPNHGQYHSALAQTRLRIARKVIGPNEISDGVIVDPEVAKEILKVFAEAVCKKELIITNAGLSKLFDLPGTVCSPLSLRDLVIRMIDWDGKMNQLNRKEAFKLDMELEAIANAEDDRGGNILMAKWDAFAKPPAVKSVQMTLRSPYSAFSRSGKASSLRCVPKQNAEPGMDIWIPEGRPKVDTWRTQKLPCVFIPTYNRSERACLELGHTINLEDRVVVLVTRNGEEFNRYRAKYGDVLCVLALPETRTFDYGGSVGQVTLKAAEHGIGFARLFIQEFALKRGLDLIWLLDDNIVTCYDQLLGKPCRFDKVMHCLERVFLDGDSEYVDEARKFKFTEHLKSSFAAPSDEQASDGQQQTATNVKEYSGVGFKKYGLLGIWRENQYGRDFDELQPVNFSTFSIFSMLLLNVKETCARRAFFPAKQILEDIEFMHRVDEVGLAVGKFARFSHRKKYFPRNADDSTPFERITKWLKDEYCKRRGFNVSLLTERPWNDKLVATQSGTWQESLMSYLADEGVFVLQKNPKGTVAVALVEDDEPMPATSENWKELLKKLKSPAIELLRIRKNRPAANGQAEKKSRSDYEPYSVDDRILIEHPEKPASQRLVWQRPMPEPERRVGLAAAASPGGPNLSAIKAKSETTSSIKSSPIKSAILNNATPSFAADVKSATVNLNDLQFIPPPPPPPPAADAKSAPANFNDPQFIPPPPAADAKRRRQT